MTLSIAECCWTRLQRRMVEEAEDGVTEWIITVSKAKRISTYSLCYLQRTDLYEIKTGSFMGVAQCRKNLGDVWVPAVQELSILPEWWNNWNHSQPGIHMWSVSSWDVEEPSLPQLTACLDLGSVQSKPNFGQYCISFVAGLLTYM